MGGKKPQTGTTCRAPTSQRRLGCALVRRGASVLADGFGPGAHRLPGTAQRFLPYEGWATDGHDMSCTYTSDRQVILRRVRSVPQPPISVLPILPYTHPITLPLTPLL